VDPSVNAAYASPSINAAYASPSVNDDYFGASANDDYVGASANVVLKYLECFLLKYLDFFLLKYLDPRGSSMDLLSQTVKPAVVKTWRKLAEQVHRATPDLMFCHLLNQRVDPVAVDR
jgi:hypothetical protein